MYDLKLAFRQFRKSPGFVATVILTISLGKAQVATDRLGVVRYYRHDTIVSGWEIKQESPGRLKLKNPVLYRKVELCQAPRNQSSGARA